MLDEILESENDYVLVSKGQFQTDLMVPGNISYWEEGLIKRFTRKLLKTL